MREGKEMANARKKGNNLYNRRIAVLVIDDWKPYQIYRHIMTEEQAVYANEPVSYATVYRRATLYQGNRADLERWYNNDMSAEEANIFAKRMKLA